LVIDDTLKEEMMTRRAKGISLHIGLNQVDPAHYEGWDGALQGCENDAHDLAEIAESAGFESSLLLSAAGRAGAVTGAISAAAGQLRSGDIFVLTYSGHGSQLPDTSNDPDETDHRDETWVLYDRQLVDDELYRLWHRFDPGVRILVLSDSCHSGSAIRELPGEPVTNAPRTMPRAEALAVYKAHKALYDGLRERNAGEAAAPRAHVLLLSGCQDDQTSADGARNGLFTQTLLGVWDDGHYRGGYRRFYNEIVAKMPPWQRPNWMTVGPANVGFTRRKPFKI